MAEELGKIDKPLAEDYKKGRKLYFVPLVFSSGEAATDYLEIFERYWEQIRQQITEMEIKLGAVKRIYHELIPAGGEDGSQAIKQLNQSSHNIIRDCIEKGACLEVLEDDDLLTEFMDWNRCLFIGLQNQKVFSTVYDAYSAAVKKRNEHIAGKIDKTLLADETGILLMRENHQVQFPPDIQVFYVSPPALDEIKRWLRDHEAKPVDES